MYNDEEILNFIYQNAEMGIEGIDKILSKTDDHRFREHLQGQHQEYKEIMQRAEQMLNNKHYPVKSKIPAAKVMLNTVSDAKTLFSKSPSKLAEMMIQGNTMGVVKMIKHMNDYEGNDIEVNRLAGKVIKMERTNIDKLKQFL